MKRFVLIKHHIRFIFLIVFWCLFTAISTAQTATFTTSGSWTCPAGVTSVNVACWAGGGGGGGVSINNSAGAGGGGGAYNASTAVAVIPGIIYNITVGTGGAGGSATGPAAGATGGNTFFNINTAIANGGIGGNINGGLGGAGGAAGINAGGAGAAGGSSLAPGSGGGGGSAGASGPGGLSSGFAGGAAGLGGGATGAAGFNTYPPLGEQTGNSGTVPGSGGGGGRKNNTAVNQAGGAGAAGGLTVTWVCLSYNLLTAAASAATACQGNGSAVTLTSSTLTSGTYTVTFNLSAPNAATGNTATMIFTAGSPGTGTFTTSNLANLGATTVTVTNLASGSATGTVTGQTNCNTNITTNNTASITISAAPAQPSVITGPGPGCAGTSQVYSVTAVGGVTYTWNTPPGWVITAGQGTSSVTYTVGASATISVTPFQASCNGTPRILAVTTTSIAPGTYTVGPTGNYTSITSVVTALSACALTGAYIFELQPAYVSTGETFPIIFPALTGAGAVNTVTFRPQTSGSNIIITGSAAASLIDLNAARYIIFDGRAGGAGTVRDLTIINTNTLRSTIGFRGDAQFNTVRFCNIQGSNSNFAEGVIWFQASSSLGGNSNNLIDNCNITKGSGSPVNGIYSAGTTIAGRRNVSNTVSNCNVFDIFNGTSNCSPIHLSGGTTDWTINANSFYLTAAVNNISIGNAEWVPIKINNTVSGNNFQITNNFIGGRAPLAAAGAAMTITGGGSFKAIKISGGPGTANRVSGNIIKNIAFTTDSIDVNAIIYHSDGSINITGNTIGSQSAAGDITFTSTKAGAIVSGVWKSPSIAGILAGGAIDEPVVFSGVVNITSNTIGGINITRSGSGDAEFRGIDFENSYCTFTVANNIIGSTSVPNSISNNSNNATAGIIGFAGTAGVTHVISGNTVQNISSSLSDADSRVTGIAAPGDPMGVYSITNNAVSDLSSNFLHPSGIGLIGMSCRAQSGGQLISDNIVKNLVQVNTGPSVTFGILFGSVSSGVNSILRNRVRNITSASAVSGIIRGIDNNTPAGTTTIANNMVVLGYDAAGAFITSSISIAGIFDRSLGGTNNISYNSVHITGGPVTNNAALNTFAFQSNSTFTKVLQNNLFINSRSNGTGTGKHYAVRTNTTTGFTSDYNDLYVSGIGGFTGNFNGTDQATLTAWQSATGGDANSIDAAAGFINPATDLHLTASPSVINFPISNEGTPIAVLTDVDGATRSLYAPDPGFDEFRGTGSWIGLTSTIWELSGNAGAGGNWDDGIVPTPSLHAKVRNAPNMPIITGTTGTGTVNDFDLKSPGVLTINGGVLEVNGNFVIKAGYLNPITASNGTVEMKGTAAQSIPAALFVSNNLKALVINNSSGVGVTLGGTLDIYESVTYAGTGRTLNTGNFLTFKSLPGRTARFGIMTGNTIAGQATVERYFSQLRKWQYLSVPTDNTQTVKAAWQEGATMISQNPAAGFGMQITQFTGGTGLGFDAFSPGGPSVKTYNSATDNYTGITNTTNPIKTTGGYMAFVRGDRLSLGSPATTTNPTTLRTKGLLYTGTQPVINAGANLFAGIGNPYASGVTISDLVMTGLVGTTPTRGTIYLWDPSLTGSFGLGGFQTLTFNSGTSAYDATPGGGLFGATCNRLESGQAFFTRGGGAGGTLTFSETAKATGSSLVSFTGSHTGMAATLRIHLYAKSIGNTALVDGTLTYFNENFSDGTDGMDASKLTNTGENLGIASNGATLAVDYRSMPDNNDTIFLSSKNLKAAKYKFQIFAADLALAGREAFLEDKYLLTKTPLYLTDTADADFEVINVPGSYAADRFFITFKYTAPPVAITDLTAVRLPAKTAEIKWKARNEAAIDRYETEHSLYGTDFRKLGATAAHNNAGGNAAYSFTDLSASAEENYYRVKGIAENGEIFYSGVAKLEALPGKSLITVSPNPVTGKTIHLVMSGQLPGAYSLRLINDAGQVIYTGVVQLNTNFQNFDIALNKTTAAGVYTLFIHRDNGKNLSLRVSIN